MARYRITEKLAKFYEVYVDADSEEEAKEKGRALIDDGMGDLVDDYPEGEPEIQKFNKYLVRQDIKISLYHHCEAPSKGEALQSAANEFNLAIGRLKSVVKSDDVHTGQIEVRGLPDAQK